MPTNCFLIGAGGHAKVVLDALNRLNQYNVTIWDDNLDLAGQTLLNLPIRTPVRFESLSGKGHVAIGDAQVRQKFAEKLKKAGFGCISVIHPDSIVANSSHIGDGCFIAASAIVAPDSSLGTCVIVNHGAVVDHDCKVGDFSHIAPNATLGGGSNIGKGCLIGAGAVILPGIRIVDDVTIGAGAVVTSHILKNGAVLYGVPAK